MVLVFLKTYFKVSVLETFKISSDKNMPISQKEGYFENSYYRFLEELMFFLLTLKGSLQEKAFSCVKTKTNQILP